MTFVDKTQKAAAASTSATDRKAVVQEPLHEQAATAFPTEPVRRGERTFDSCYPGRRDSRSARASRRQAVAEQNQDRGGAEDEAS